LNANKGLKAQLAIVLVAFCFLFFSSLSSAQTSSINLTVAENEYSLGENITVEASLTPNTYVTFEVADSEGNPVLVLTNQTDASGTTDVSFKLGPGEDIGNYTITASANNYGSSLSGSLPIKISHPSPITFEPRDITFSNLNPASGQTVQIYVVMHNSLSTSVIGEVKFFDGSLSTQIGTTTLVWFPSSNQKVVSLEWTPTNSGVHNIIVSVDCGLNYKEHSESTDITVGGTAQSHLVLTTGDINIYRFRPGEIRTLSVDVTCYGMTVNNVHLVCLDNQNLTVDTSITPARTMNDGQTTPFYLRIQAPDSGDKSIEYRLILQVKGDEAYSNAEALDVVITEGALSFFMGNIAYFGAAAGIGLTTAGIGVAKNESWKYFL
jgi:hypothetical protein